MNKHQQKVIRPVLCLLGLLPLWPTIATAQVTNFTVSVTGAQNVVVGHTLYLRVDGLNRVGSDIEMVTPSITGLPAGITPHWLNMEYNCCGTKLYNFSTMNTLALVVSPTTQAGTFPLVVSLKTDGGVARSVPFVLTVWTAFPTVPKATSYPADTPLTELPRWESQMNSVGGPLCFDSSTDGESHVWYYDGMRVFYQIADYTRSSSWNNCAAIQRSAYRPLVLAAGGVMPGWEVFPEGLVMDYERTGDTTSREAALLLFDKQAYSHPKPNTYVVGAITGWDYSREVSYAINTHLAHERLGYPRDPDIQVLVEDLLGHFDQWFISKRAPYVQPFMVGLAAESLIAYYETDPDPRIPYVLKLAADYMWANCWDVNAHGFRYDNGNGTTSNVADLNLLVAPIYGWLYRFTGDVSYRNLGDQAFNGGVDYAYLGAGKFFSQNYRWSGKYVEWRKKPTGSVTAPISPTSTASFVKLDTTTQGNWKSAYGSEGYRLMGDGTLNPSYVAPTNDSSTWIWAASTSDTRALQKVSSTGRIAATWYSYSPFTIDLNFTDQATHQVAIYLLDWDGGGRQQKIEILDANNTILDTRTASNFVNGQYLVWNLSGHVKIRTTPLTTNAVIAAIFFGGPPVSGSTASFVKLDTTTQGNWKSAYGSEGYRLMGDGTLNPSYVAPTNDSSTWIWAASTSDTRALQKVSSTGRIAATWYSYSPFTIDLNFTDQATHQVAIYLLDWDGGGRQQKIEILDANNTILDTRTASNFVNGQYLVWNLSGHVKIRTTPLTTNAVIAAIFFGGPPVSGSTASFVKLDTTTQGNWKSAYGSEGYRLMGDGTLNPSYVAPTNDSSTWIWAASTSDTRALQKVSSTGRIAATWYSYSPFTIDLNFTDQATHQVAIYLLDWDGGGRQQKIEILDANNTILDTRTASNFVNGQYLVWNLSGHVKIRTTPLTTNAVIAAIFFK